MVEQQETDLLVQTLVSRIYKSEQDKDLALKSEERKDRDDEIARQRQKEGHYLVNHYLHNTSDFNHIKVSNHSPCFSLGPTSKTGRQDHTQR
jgi:hypothetical protein